MRKETLKKDISKTIDILIEIIENKKMIITTDIMIIIEININKIIDEIKIQIIEEIAIIEMIIEMNNIKKILNKIDTNLIIMINKNNNILMINIDMNYMTNLMIINLTQHNSLYQVI